MPGGFRDASAPRFGSTELPRPEDLPHGLVVPPPEIVTQVARERASFPPEVYTDAYAKRVLDDWTLNYYYEGLDIAYRSVPEGVEVLAVGVEEIGRLVQGKSPEELLSFTIKEA